MRELKFRVWDKDEKSWCAPDKLEWCILPNPFVLQPFSGIFELDESNKERDSAYSLGTTYEVMRYTGLKDKNGKEMCEGDIVRANIYTDDHLYLEVYYHNGCFIIDYKDSEADYFCVGDFPGSLEVVGNIYENPELLERDISGVNER
jgi:hypothetical protein